VVVGDKRNVENGQNLRELGYTEFFSLKEHFIDTTGSRCSRRSGRVGERCEPSGVVMLAGCQELVAEPSEESWKWRGGGRKPTTRLDALWRGGSGGRETLSCVGTQLELESRHTPKELQKKDGGTKKVRPRGKFFRPRQYRLSENIKISIRGTD